MFPVARTDDLLMEEAGRGELVVYDLRKNRAHNLNRTAAVVWRGCDGTKSIEDIAAILRAELSDAADENVVSVALDLLGSADLMDFPAPRPMHEHRSSRRQVVQKVGLVGILSLIMPTVATLAVPTPAQAASCIDVCSNSQESCRTSVPPS